LNYELEEVISATEKVPAAARAAMKSAPSLRPGTQMMEAASMGNVEAIMIRNAWAFRFPVRVVSREEFEEMVEKGTVTFVG
jgi:hypothetical protein